jgi:peptide/nickel transport system substrate-binding protein
VKVRRALAYAIDKDAINDVVWDGTRKIANSAFSPDSAYFIETPEAPTYDPDEAKKLLDEYGKPVSVTLECINTPESQQLLQLVEQMWEAVGVDVDLIFTEQGQFVNKIYANKDYVTACFRSNQFAEPDQLYTTYKTGSPANVLQYANPEMDAALEEGRSTAVLAERKEAYAKVQRISAQTVPSVTFAYDLFSNIYRSAVHGLPVPEAKSLGAIKTATIWIEK